MHKGSSAEAVINNTYQNLLNGGITTSSESVQERQKKSFAGDRLVEGPNQPQLQVSVPASICRKDCSGQSHGGWHLLLVCASVCTLLNTAQALCPILVKYEATLGQAASGLASLVPPFSGTVSVYSNNATVSTWKLGWEFTDGEVLRQQQDIFTSGVDAISLSNSTVQIQSYVNNTVLPFNWTGISFLAYRASTTGSNNTYGVAPISNVAFNNLLCSQLPSMQESASTPSVAVEGNDTITTPYPLLVEYSPVDFIGASAFGMPDDAVPSTTFLTRITNMGTEMEAISISSLNLQYWFNGPDQTPDTADALSIFTFSCLEATYLGCGKVTWNITQGLPGVLGARYVLNIGFDSGSGLLLSNETGNSTIEDPFLLPAVELLLRINSTQPFTTSMNTTQDFSYINTSRSAVPITNATTIIPRQAQANPKLPAYIAGDVVWGTKPIMGEALSPVPLPGPLPAAADLPPGITCLSTVPAGTSGLAGTGSNSVQVCGLFSSYCCYGKDDAGVDPTIPYGPWPPSYFPVPANILQNGTALASGPTPAQAPAVGLGPKSGSSSRAAFIPPQQGTPVQVPSTSVPSVAPDGMPKGLVNQGKGPSKAGIIAGAVTGCVVGLMAFSATCLLMRRRGRRRAKEAKFEETLIAESSSDSLVKGYEQSKPVQQMMTSKTHNASPMATSLNPGWEPSNVSPVSPDEFQFKNSKPQLSPRVSNSAASPFKGLSTATQLARTVSPEWPSMSCTSGARLHNAMSMPALSLREEAWSSVDWDEPGKERRENQTWCGVLIQTPGLQSEPIEPEVQRGHHFRNRFSILPPLRSLPPPISLSSPLAPSINLQIDFETEISPFLGECLGSGGYGSVYEGLWRGKRVAVKCLPKDGATSAQYEALIREIELSVKFNSKRLVQVYGACLDSTSTICLIMELVEGGNLHQLIHKPGNAKMTLIDALQVINDVAAGLAYMHPNIIHSDLKPQNILLDADGHAKIADFGISRVKDPAKTFLTATHTGGTPVYMAPEQFNGSHLDEKVDVYALGCILNECLTRRRPWATAPNFFQIIVQVAIRGQRPPMDPSCPEPVRRLISKCWAQDARCRPSCAEVLRMTDIMLQREMRRGDSGISLRKA